MQKALALSLLTLVILAPSHDAIAGPEVRSSDGLTSVAVGGLFIPRFELTDPSAGDTSYRFRMVKARLVVRGDALTEGLSYRLAFDVESGAAVLRDAYVRYAANRWFVATVGHHRTVFSRQRATGLGAQALAGRSATDGAFRAGFDMGLTLQSDPNKANFEWAWGIFNGARFHGGAATAAPSRFGPVFALRLGYHSDGMKGYSDVDFEGGGFRWAIGYGNLTDLGEHEGSGAKVVSTTPTLDFAIKANGFAATGAWFMRMAGPSWGDVESELMGLHAELNYLFDGRFVPAARFTMLDPDGDGNNSMIIEGGFGWFFFGHKLKWQTQIAATLPEEGDTGISAVSQLVFGL